MKEQLPDKDCLILVIAGQRVTLATWTKADGRVLDRAWKHPLALTPTDASRHSHIHH